MQWFSLHTKFVLQFLFSVTRFLILFTIFSKFLVLIVCCTLDLCVRDTYTYPFRYVNTTQLVSFANRSSLLSQWMAMPSYILAAWCPTHSSNMFAYWVRRAPICWGRVALSLMGCCMFSKWGQGIQRLWLWEAGILFIFALRNTEK